MAHGKRSSLQTKEVIVILYIWQSKANIMAKLDWQKVYKKGTTKMKSDYWSNPKSGFDKHWHQQQAKLQAQKDRQARDKALAMIRANKKTSDDCPF